MLSTLAIPAKASYFEIPYNKKQYCVFYFGYEQNKQSKLPTARFVAVPTAFVHERYPEGFPSNVAKRTANDIRNNLLRYTSPTSFETYSAINKSPAPIREYFRIPSPPKATMLFGKQFTITDAILESHLPHSESFGFYSLDMLHQLPNIEFVSEPGHLSPQQEVTATRNIPNPAFDNNVANLAPYPLPKPARRHPPNTKAAEGNSPLFPDFPDMEPTELNDDTLAAMLLDCGDGDGDTDLDIKPTK